MQRTIIEQTDAWQIESHGNGVAYAFTRKSDGKEAFLQGDDATQWWREYESMVRYHADYRSVWFRKTWNDCLSQLCGEYVELMQ